MYKHATAAVHFSALPVVCAWSLPSTCPVAQPLIDKGVTFGKPLDEVCIVNVINRNVQMLVASKELRVVRRLPIYDRDYMGDFAVG